jgi:hypothetical protein
MTEPLCECDELDPRPEEEQEAMGPVHFVDCPVNLIAKSLLTRATRYDVMSDPASQMVAKALRESAEAIIKGELP